MIYQTAEDSYLLSKEIKDYLKKQTNKNLSILDMGSGSGIQAQTCKKQGFNNIITADINPEAINNLKKQGFNTIQSNLFSKIDSAFDLIIFNPPYLPKDKREPRDSKPNTTAGEKGYEIIIKFLSQAKSYLNKKATILLLFSSLSKPKIILNKTKQLNYKIKLLSKQKLFFEELFVYEFSYV